MIDHNPDRYYQPGILFMPFRRRLANIPHEPRRNLTHATRLFFENSLKPGMIERQYRPSFYILKTAVAVCRVRSQSRCR